MCGDYKVTVNNVSHLEQYSIQRLEDLMVTLGVGKTFTKLDLSHAYNQMELDDESSRILTINNTQRGLFKVNRLPFGISSAPAIFQRALESLVKDIPNVIVYLDDLLITGVDEESHLKTLEALSRLLEAGLRLKREKCSFQYKEVEYLGHKIDAEGIHPLEKKMKANSTSTYLEEASRLSRITNR